MDNCTIGNRQKLGNWFFKNRSYLPLVLMPFVFIELYFESNVNYLAESDFIWAFIPFAISFCGLLIRVMVIGKVPGGTSSRNTVEGQVADYLNTKGLYSVVRHPLYVGNFFMWIGIALYTQNLLVVALFITIFWIMYQNITLAEELYLEENYGDSYREWASKTPAFFPKLSQFQPSTDKFSFRTVLKKEYSGMFAIVVIFTFLTHYRGLVHGQLMLSKIWLGVFLVGMVLYLTLRTLKHKTRILHVSGR